MLKSESRHERFEFYSGHFYRPLKDFLGFDLDVVTVLRDPIDRTISHFEHVLRARDHYFYDHVNRHKSLLEFVLDPITRPLVENFQTKCLVDSFDPVKLAATLSADVHPHALEQLIETRPFGTLPIDAAKAARSYLESALCIGVTENLDDFIRIVARHLNLATPDGLHRLNVKPSDSLSAAKLTTEERDAIEKATAIDRLIHDFAYNAGQSYR